MELLVSMVKVSGVWLHKNRFELASLRLIGVRLAACASLHIIIAAQARAAVLKNRDMAGLSGLGKGRVSAPDPIDLRILL